MRCNICSRTDGEIIEVENPSNVRDHRRFHQSCQDAVDAHCAGEATRTAKELGHRIDALYAPTV